VAQLREVAGGLLLVLDPDEVDLLLTLSASLLSRVNSRSAQPGDPILARFAPTASRGDEAAAAELQDLLADGLMELRQDRLVSLRDDLTTWSSLGAVERTLDRSEALRLIEVLNDLRLALGASVGIETLQRAELAADDPRASTLGLMDHLGWMQGRLIDFVGT
jgi:hypothetical protein